MMFDFDVTKLLDSGKKALISTFEGSKKNQKENKSKVDKSKKNKKQSYNLTGLAPIAAQKTNLLIAQEGVVVTSAYRSPKHSIEKGKKKPGPHTTGMAIDIRPGSNNGMPTTWQHKNYDRELTQKYVDAILKIDPDAKLLFNDSKINGVKKYPGHNHHIHITWSGGNISPKVRENVRQNIIEIIRRQKGIVFKTRSDWKAQDQNLESDKSPNQNLESDKSPKSELKKIYHSIAIHHAGNSFSRSESGEQLMRNVEEKNLKKFKQLSYHYAIDSSGTIYEGLDIMQKGAHIEGGNSGVIGIVFLSDFSKWGESFTYGGSLKDLLEDAVDFYYDEPTEAQENSAKILIEALKSQFYIITLGGHREYAKQKEASRTCPGKYGMEIVIKLRKEFNLAAPSELKKLTSIPTQDQYKTPSPDSTPKQTSQQSSQEEKKTADSSKSVQLNKPINKMAVSQQEVMDLAKVLEGVEKKAYKDIGSSNIGVGFNLDKRSDAKEILQEVGADYDKIKSGDESLTTSQIEKILAKTVEIAISDAKNIIANFDELPHDAQLVMAYMSFNLGGPRFAGFKKLKQALRIQDFSWAIKEMKDSRWYHQISSAARSKLVSMIENLI